ncbi:MAG TPA: uL15m family ribosomal protein [Candidatus Nanoarchaeia archaeon]|nr:uL15m family ribosomal protein [Candidatus Nanoarchaeia archaeon]
MIKTKKRKKSGRMHGRKMGTHGTGARKKKKGSGHRGGIGMSGTGKRADQKKTLVLKLYGHGYFGKQGITSKRTAKDKRDRINLYSIETNIDSYLKNGIAKKTNRGIEINLKNYKILSEGGVKDKLIINALGASKLAIDKVKKAGGEIIIKKPEKNKEVGKKEGKSEKKERKQKS